ncbi:MAG: PmoA family protein, partial [Planctomycetota bacterium]|nr:PmoA family protein [Planctomycetota bacterium]
MGKAINLTIHAGPHCRHDTPMTVDLGTATKGQSQARLVEIDTGREIPCQFARGHLAFILPGLGTREERRYQVEFGVEAIHQGGVRLSDAGEKGLLVAINGQPFTTYRCLPKGEYPIVARPFFYPVYGPDGVGMTRNYPMRSDVAGEQQDHPHHRGLYVAFGDVNGTDNWSEEKGHGYQSHQRFLEVTSGPVFGRFTELLHWEGADRHKVCEEVRVFTAWDLPHAGRIIDLSVSFIATEGPLKFGDTKEGGIVSVRVPTSMDANKGGAIENSANGLGEAETWGRSAQWV